MHWRSSAHPRGIVTGNGNTCKCLVQTAQRRRQAVPKPPTRVWKSNVLDKLMNQIEQILVFLRDVGSVIVTPACNFGTVVIEYLFIQPAKSHTAPISLCACGPTRT